MDTLGLPAPNSLFSSATTALATILAIQKAAALGEGITIAELVGAGVLSEGLLVAGGVTAAFYAGACVGCMATATGLALAE